jgi:hypothetical protein
MALVSLLQLGNALRCPATKFITHTLSHLCFLLLLAAATFRLEDKSYPITCTEDITNSSRYRHLEEADKADSLLKATFRPANILMTNVQICLMFWVLGEAYDRIFSSNNVVKVKELFRVSYSCYAMFNGLYLSPWRG